MVCAACASLGHHALHRHRLAAAKQTLPLPSHATRLATLLPLPPQEFLIGLEKMVLEEYDEEGEEVSSRCWPGWPGWLAS